MLDASEEEISAAVADVEQAFTGTGGIFATDLVDLATFSTAVVTGSVDLATVIAGGGGAADATSAAPVATDGAAACPVEAPATVSSACSVITTTVAADATDAVIASMTSATVGAVTDVASGTVDIQAFTGALGGPPPPVESSSGDRPFSVNGNTFTGADAAIGRSCDIQHNACFDAVNSGELAGGTAQCEEQVADCKAANALKRRQASDFGSCSDPTIIFADGLDGRTEGAFAPANSDDFNHGSALKIGVIAGFICQQLTDSCKAGTAVVESCASASEAAVAATQDQTAADVFNQGLGVAAGGDAADAPAAIETPVPTATVSSVVMTITQCA